MLNILQRYVTKYKPLVNSHPHANRNPNLQMSSLRQHLLTPLAKGHWRVRLRRGGQNDRPP